MTDADPELIAAWRGVMRLRDAATRYANAVGTYRPALRDGAIHDVRFRPVVDALYRHPHTADLAPAELLRLLADLEPPDELMERVPPRRS